MKIFYAFIVVSLWIVVACVTIPETGRKAFIVTSEAQEIELGTSAYQDVLKKERVSRDPRLNGILQRVGKRIAAAANKPNYQWQFTLIESTQQNAFALPGGKVAFYTGILSVCQNEAGIATVMGHEVAHATARHGGQRMSVALGTQAGLVTAQMLLGGNSSTTKDTVLGALGLGAQFGVLMPFSRSNEAEADEIGLIYMARAGYDPRQASQFWSRFANKGGEPPEFLSTHPSSSNRSRSLQEQLPSVMPIYDRSPRFGSGESL